MPRLSLTGKFGVLSAVVVVLIGVVLGTSLAGLIRQRARESAREAATLVARIGIEPHLTAAELRSGITPAHRAMLDSAVGRSGVIGRQILSLTVWDASGGTLYTSARPGTPAARSTASSGAPAAAPRPLPPSPGLASALSGRVSDEVERPAGAARQLAVYVPLRVAGGGRHAGALEIALPYAPIAAAVSHDTHALYLLLAGLLAVLYAALFRIVLSASRRLTRQAAENEHLALHDPLTGLPNRTLFRDRLEQQVLAAQRGGERLALMLMDLDRFKEINDTLGHHTGDTLLQQIGPRLRTTLRASDSIARLGGDEFAVLLPDISGIDEVEAVAFKLRTALEEPFALDGLSLAVEASIGVALYPEHGSDIETLVRRADVAMYVAKGSRSGCEIYAAETDTYTPQRLELLGQLRHALERGELVLHYHPKASVSNGRVTGVEALVRWQHPQRGLVYPDDFIPLAEHTGLIRPLTQYVLDAALRQCRAWCDEGLRLTVAVNVSLRNLLDVSLPDQIAELLERWGVDPSLLELELTENSVMADPARAEAVLARLRALGLKLSIDDFGTGYSSLSYLKRLPVDEIKIDRSFVMNMATDENDAAIVRSAIDLARNLGLQIVAEGVESEAIWRSLAALDCDLVQGYLLTKPVPADALAAWVTDGDAARASLAARLRPAAPEGAHPVVRPVPRLAS